MSTLWEIIRHEIHKSGILPFARFMELALYCPDCGYYETKVDIGRRGDFYTSVSAGELFGQLLAFQFANWLETEVPKSKVRIVEAGAHNGQLAKDILSWLQSSRPELFSQIEYAIIEPSVRRREWQKETLAGFKEQIGWLEQISDLKNRQPAIGNRQFTIVFSNELLDACPVHRFGWDANGKKWFEWGVAADGDKLVWAKLENSELPASILNLPSSLLAVLPDGYILETSPAAENWWREAGGVLARGKLLTIDYGFTDGEMLSPDRPRGTLRAYFRHHVTDNLLANPGELDLTAHVNFSAIRKAGEEAELKTEFFGSQAKFLTEILAKTAGNNSFGVWNAKQNRQFQTLTHPEHLGRAFRALVQSRQSS